MGLLVRDLPWSTSGLSSNIQQAKFGMMHLNLLLLFFGLLVKSSQSSRCSPTTRDMLGPFFEKNAPADTEMSPVEEADKISVKGVILDRRCRPVGGATVEVWHAGLSGNSTTEPSYTFPPDKLWYRGKFTTDEAGRYHYLTTFPGVYSKRPIQHIHYKVTARGVELVTQLYFAGHIPSGYYEDYVKNRQTQFPQAVGLGWATFDIVLEV